MVLLLLVFCSSIFAADPTSVDSTLKKRRRSCSSHNHAEIAAPEPDAPAPIEIERTISAADFPRWLNARLKYAVCPELKSLSESECLKPECRVIIHYHGGNGRVRSLAVYDPDHSLMNGEVFTPTDHNLLPVDGIRRGTRHVGFYSLDNERVFCLKENPEVPALERSARILYECLFGIDTPGIPNSETILINGKVFTASSYVTGESFDEIIRQIEGDEEKEHNIAITNLLEMKIFVILTAPEDGRAQNYILQTISNIDGKVTCTIYSIDNERILGNATPHPSRRDAAVTVRSHSIIHCFPETIHDYSGLAKALSSSTPRNICNRWIELIKIEKAYHRHLIPYAKLSGSNTRLLSTPITRDRNKVVYDKLKHISEGLEADQTLKSLFMQVDNPLAMIYHPASIDSPVTPPRDAASSDDSSTTPGSSIRKVVRRIQAIDGGRTGETTPPSACCQLFGDYLPSQHDDAQPTLEAILSPIQSGGTLLSPLPSPGALLSPISGAANLPSTIDSVRTTETDIKRRRLGTAAVDSVEGQPRA